MTVSRKIKRKNQRTETARRGERGYSLVALMALMTIIVLALMAAVPSARHQSQRDREQEAIFRGEEVADAIAIYLRRSGHLPSSMDDLLEGVPVGVKKLKILRAEAAIDPLTGHDWKLVHQTDPNFLEFERAIAVYAGGRLPNAHDPAVQQLQASIAGQVGIIIDTETSKPTSCHEDTEENSTGPFLGVVSRSECSSIIAYYGIERHDQWIFTPLFR